MPQDIDALAKFILDESVSSGDHFMQAAVLIRAIPVKNEVIKSLRAEVSEADEQMKLLAAENLHLMNLLVNMQRDSFTEMTPTDTSLSVMRQINHQRVKAEQGFRASMPATNKIIDLIRMEYLAELSRMTCPTSGPVFEKNAQESFAELMIMLKGEDDDA